jgi:hypothetical protein
MVGASGRSSAAYLTLEGFAFGGSQSGSVRAEETSRGLEVRRVVVPIVWLIFMCPKRLGRFGVFGSSRALGFVAISTLVQPALDRQYQSERQLVQCGLRVITVATRQERESNSFR